MLQKVILLDYKEIFPQRNREHQELSKYVWEATHTTFPITCTNTTISQLPTGEDGVVIEPTIFRQEVTQYHSLPKVESIEDSSSKLGDEKQRQDQTIKELRLVTLRVAKFYER